MRRVFIICLALFVSSFELLSQLGPGDFAPDFTVVDVHGDTHTLSNYTSNGQYVVLDFFFYDCIPCQYYTPQIEQAHLEYGCNEHDVVFLGIDYNDDNAKVLQYEQTFGGTYPSASGTQGGGNAVVSSYQIFGYPYVILISPDDTILHEFDPPTLLVFDFYFDQFGVQENSCGVSIGDERAQQFKLYPNPSSGKFLIEGKPGAVISVRDVMGREVYSNVMLSRELQIDLQHLPGGTYVANIDDVTIKFLLSFD